MTLASRTLGATTNDIATHYDIGNRFYALWLDPSWVYSCAMWEPGDDLTRAQQRKLTHHIEQARAPGKKRVLDIGCGWGALLQQLVNQHGVQRALGLTLSDAQASHVRALRDPRIDVRTESWEAHVPEEPYDAIISIGALEHFVRPEMTDAQRVARYAEFFRVCRSWLAPGARMSLQTIAYGNMPGGKLASFITDEVFPGSDLPRLHQLAAAFDGPFRVVLLRNDPVDYARTCTEWCDRMLAHRTAAESMVGPQKVLVYERYLRMSAAGFNKGALNLYRITLEAT